MKPRVPERSEFRFWSEEKLRNADTDQFRHVNNAAMASFFEAGRMEVFASSEMRALLGSANLAVVRLLIDFHRELYYPGRVAIGSSVVRVGERSLEFRQGLFDDDGCVASAQAVCVLIDPSSARAQLIDAALRDRLVGAA